ncbi:MAG: AraC family transcriptional regulator [Lachnospiraceae bacterium]|nr:AraC family transcriptional regulator [Lachnospiraceae bacterium]
MKSTEKLISENSEYFLYTPGVLAKELFFYPTIIGRFEYEPGYRVRRAHMDNFLIMLIEEGVCDIVLSGKSFRAPKGSFVILDCHDEHEYGSDSAWKALWVHFDGPLSRSFYRNIVESRGNVILPKSYPTIHYELNSLYLEFLERKPIDEARASLHLSAILNSVLSQESEAPSRNYDGLKRAIAYINEHFAEENPLEKLSSIASLSPFYFSRLFRNETGLTPHQYLIETRISAARFLLSSTPLSIKEIALKTGFTDESSFCACFRKREGTTPATYRKKLGTS